MDEKDKEPMDVGVEGGEIENVEEIPYLGSPLLVEWMQTLR